MLVQVIDCSQKIMKQCRSTGRLVKYLMCEYACTQFNNIIKFKNIQYRKSYSKRYCSFSMKYTGIVNCLFDEKREAMYI